MSNSEKRMSPIVNMSCKFNQFFFVPLHRFCKKPPKQNIYDRIFNQVFRPLLHIYGTSFPCA